MQMWVWRRISRFLDDSPLVLASGLALLCLPAVVALSWTFSERWQSERFNVAIERESQHIARQLNEVEADIELVFSQVTNVTNWLARDENVVQAILSPAAAQKTNRYLKELVSTFSVDLVYVMDANGISVASSNADTAASTVGMDYSDREHFLAAIQGYAGRQFAVGRTTKVPGFFFSMPVRQGGKIIGTIAVKLNQQHLQLQARIPNGLLTDSYGVVVMADNPAYVFRMLPTSTVSNLPEVMQLNRYAQKQFDVLDFRPAKMAGYPNIMLLDGQPVLIGSRILSNENLNLHIVADMEALLDAQKQTRFIFMVSVAGGALVVWGLWAAVIFFLRARDYRRRLEILNSQLSKLNDELHEQATHDYLTGCLNRRAFSALLNNELERVKRYGGDLTLGVIDIDYFKRINDTRGHAVGDLALQFLTENVRTQLRRTDVMARLGGEEFALLMPNTPLHEAVQVIDRMRDSLAQRELPGELPPLRMTFSAGVAGWQPGMNDRTLMNAADHALYDAKASGRNRVVQARGY